MTATYFVTGGAGFIGSNLVDRLLSRGARVVAFDNFSTGHAKFLERAGACPGFRFIEGDILDESLLKEAMQGCDFVFHLAANADVRFGAQHPRRDLEQNTIATFNVLDAMRVNGIRKIAFSSTGSIYGEPEIFPTPENAPFPVQTSLYGASKLAGEGLINAYCETFGFQSWIFRFVSVLGDRYTHGHIFDFYKKLLADPTTLPVLGDGNQRKSYMTVSDCLDAMELAVANADVKVNIFNLGADATCTVKDSIGWICEVLQLRPKLVFAGGTRGWIGDSPLIHLDTSRIRALGWKPAFNIQEGVVRTVNWLAANRWALDARR